MGPGLFPSRADSLSHGVPGPGLEALRLPNYIKLKAGNVNPSAGHLTTNHLLANPGLDLITPPAPAWLHYHGHGKGGNQEVTGVFS